MKAFCIKSHYKYHKGLRISLKANSYYEFNDPFTDSVTPYGIYQLKTISITTVSPYPNRLSGDVFIIYSDEQFSKYFILDSDIRMRKYKLKKLKLVEVV